jgi:uncharacterized protein (DUF736 family)
MNIGAGWKKTAKSGVDYLSCVIQSPFLPGGELRFAIFKVEDKKSEKSPDYNLVWSDTKKDNQQGGQTSEQAPPYSDDDISF